MFKPRLAKFYQCLSWLLSTHPAARRTAALTVLAFVVWWLYGRTPTLSLPGVDRPTKPSVAQTPGTNESSTVAVESTRRATDEPEVVTRFERSDVSVAEEFASIESAALEERIDLLLIEFNRLGEELDQWQSRVDRLSGDDVGRRIVSDESNFETAMTLVTTSLVSPADWLTLEKRFRALERERHSRLSRSSVEQLREAIEAIEKRVDEIQSKLDSSKLALDQIEQETRTLSPAPQTFDEATKRHEQNRAMKQAEARRERQSQAERELAENAAKNDAMLAKLEIEKQNAIALAEQERLKLEAEAARLRGIDDAARLRLAAEFDRELPQIQHYLGRLFESGYTQPMSAGQFGSVEKPGPVSLAAIKKVGALNDRVDGLSGAYAYFLNMMVTTTNDRKQAGPYPANYIGGAPTTEQAAAARPGYALLKKYQTILVERGYLQP